MIANFATTVDGVAAFGPGRAAENNVTASEPADRFVMGLLRALASVVIVGAGTLRGLPHHRWTADRVFPRFEAEFARLRAARGLDPYPLNVVVSNSGRLDPTLPFFDPADVPVAVATTSAGRQRLRRAGLAPHVELLDVGRSSPLPAGGVLRSLQPWTQHGPVLVEGGPRLLGTFVAGQVLDEQFLTIAPRIGGRDGISTRLGLIDGVAFSPERTPWARLIDIRRSADFLFLRYAMRRALGR